MADKRKTWFREFAVAAICLTFTFAFLSLYPPFKDAALHVFDTAFPWATALAAGAFVVKRQAINKEGGTDGGQ